MTAERKQELIDSVEGLLVNVVHQIWARVPLAVGFDELKQAALIRLNRAVEMYDPERHASWPCYAKHHIRGGALDSLREMDTISRDARRHDHKIEAAERALEQRLMRRATHSELAEHLGISMRELARRQLAVVGLTSIDQRKTGPDRAWEPAAQRGPDELGWRDVKKLLEDAQINCLNPRQRRVLELYYRQERPMREVAVIVGVNESRISQIVGAALRKLRAEMSSRGIARSSQVLPRAA